MMPIYKKFVLSLCILYSSLYADTARGEIVVGVFNHAPSGQVQYNSIESVDIVNTLDFSTAQDVLLKAYIEHSFSPLPNLKLAYNTYLHNGQNLVPNFSWGKIENFTGTINNHLSLSFVDTTLYYELLDDWLETDAGVTFRSLSGEMSVKNRLNDDALSFSTLVPMLYGKMRLNLLDTDISLQLELNAIALPSTTSYDYEVSARYTFSMGLGIEIGYKSFYFKSDNMTKNFDANIDFTGLYTAAIWEF